MKKNNRLQDVSQNAREVKSQGQISVMISSQCKSRIMKEDGTEVPLSELRNEIKEVLEDQRVFSGQVFNVWINEAADSLSELSKSKEVCLERVKNSQILIVICNGSAGWVPKGDSIGICHLELKAACESLRKKVIFIQLSKENWPQRPNKADLAFQDYVAANNFFRGGKEAASYEDVIAQVEREVLTKMSSVMARGVRGTDFGFENAGQALEWAHLDFEKRKSKMIEALQGCIKALTVGREKAFYIESSNKKILISCHAVPDGWTTALANKYVGSPQDNDKDYVPILKSRRLLGPVHLVACYKGISENQARACLGRQDCVLLKGEFGIYAVDRVMGTQFVFLKGCRDQSSIASQVQEFQEWLETSEEIKFMVRMAEIRVALLEVISKVVEEYSDEALEKAS